MRRLLVAFHLMAAFVLAAPAAAANLRYWGLQQEGSSTGVIELEGQLHPVRVGDVIPNWGAVHAVGAHEIVVKRSLTREEKDALRGQGKAVPDAQHIHVRNVQGMLPRVVVPTP